MRRWLRRPDGRRRNEDILSAFCCRRRRGGGGEEGSCCSMTSTVNLVNWCGVADLNSDDHHDQFLCWTKKNCLLMGRSTFSSAILLTCLEIFLGQTEDMIKLIF